ncbi:dienelactone hydrolase family protein [Nocardioides sp. R-C-SC26]|uniref:dienelactone hydrolase family protein n=1 Tax=Nocardioides sp. R-C-SC26 TaxID=2870414 RepID=UPI001E3F6E73|nr:dienelactone hydrolase family protein [Nocardioides sp. R-C-SC26]
MTDVLLFHHIQGLTDGVTAFADELRSAGHTVHTPDLFDGRTFATIEEGFAFARETGFDVVRARGMNAADALDPALVYAGFSFGVTIAQRLAQTRAGARGALLMHGCLPVEEYGEEWPGGVPVQIHGMQDDEFFDEDLPAARSLAESAESAELFVYPGEQHLFTDSSLDAYDEDATALLLDRVRSLLGRL